MEGRTLKINLMSGNDLDSVRSYLKMKVYAVVTIGGDERTEKKTPVDKNNKTNPSWNFNLDYVVEEEAVLQEGVMLAVTLMCSRTLKPDRYVGEVHVSLKELFNRAAENGGSAVFNYPVRRGGSLGVQGELKFSCRFGEKEVIQQSLALSSGGE